MSLIGKIIWLGLAFVLSAPATDKTQYFVQWSFNSTLQLINDISSDLQKLLKYFNDKAILAFSGITLAWFGALWANLFSNNSVFHSKDFSIYWY